MPYYKSLSENLLSVNNSSIKHQVVCGAFYIIMQRKRGALGKKPHLSASVQTYVDAL